jgi:hypothetical protein
MLTHTHIAGAVALGAGVALITGAPRNELGPILLLGAAGGLLPDVDVPYGRAAQVLAVVEGGILGMALGGLITREILPAVAGGLAGAALGGAGLLLWLGATVLAPLAACRRENCCDTTALESAFSRTEFGP